VHKNIWYRVNSACDLFCCVCVSPIPPEGCPAQSRPPRGGQHVTPRASCGSDCDNQKNCREAQGLPGKFRSAGRSLGPISIPQLPGSKRHYAPFSTDSRQSRSVDNYAICRERCRKATKASQRSNSEAAGHDEPTALPWHALPGGRVACTPTVTDHHGERETVFRRFLES
jgi:hypothetical protein